MTEPASQTITPRTWTRLEGMPDIEIFHEEPGSIVVTGRRVPGITVMNSNADISQTREDAAIAIPWDHP